MIQQQQAYLQQRQQLIQSRLLLYDNAVYEGGFSEKSNKMNGNGAIYFLETGSFIICSNFKERQLHGYALAYNSSQSYVYGSWKLNRLHGTALIQLEKIKILAEFVDGAIKKEGKAIVLLDEGNIGILVQLKQFGWYVLERNQLYCSQHILQLIKKCRFQSPNTPLSIISFLYQLVSLQEHQLASLRFVKNIYQYAFKDGFSFIFTEQGQLLSLRLNQCQLFGQIQPKFKNMSMRNLKDQLQDEIGKQRICKSGKIYHKNQAKKNYLIAEQLENPSDQYFVYFLKSFDQDFQKKMRAGLLVNKNRNLANHNQSFRAQRIHLSQAFINQNQKQEKREAQSHTNTLKQIEFKSFSPNLDNFQALPATSRLKVIKKQQKQLLLHKLYRQGMALSASKQIELIEEQEQIKQAEKITKSIYQFKRKHKEQQSQTQTPQILPLTVDTAKPALKPSPQAKRRKRQNIFGESPQQKPIKSYEQRLEDQVEKYSQLIKSKIFEQSNSQAKYQKSQKENVQEVQLEDQYLYYSTSPEIREQKSSNWDQKQSKIEDEVNEHRTINKAESSPNKFKVEQLNYQKPAPIQAVEPKIGPINPNIVENQQQQNKSSESPSYIIRGSNPHYFAVRRQAQKQPARNFDYLKDKSQNNKLIFDYVIQ